MRYTPQIIIVHALLMMYKQSMIWFKSFGYQLTYLILIMSMQEKSENEQNALKYSCTCGRAYKSKPAVYTHIKNKHDGDKDNFRIIDNANGEVDNNRTIRLTQIKWNQIQSSLMTLADTTYLQIARIIKDEKLDEGNYLLDPNYISDSEDQEAVDLPKRLISKEIKQSGIEDIIKSAQEKNQKVLGPFKIQKFELEMKHQLAKHFRNDFYVKISIQILLYFCKKDQQYSIIQEYQSRLWKPFETKLKEKIQEYCTKWEYKKNQNP